MKLSDTKDYDVWQEENRVVLEVLTDCAVRHIKTVMAYRKLRNIMSDVNAWKLAQPRP